MFNRGSSNDIKGLRIGFSIKNEITNEADSNAVSTIARATHRPTSGDSALSQSVPIF